MSDHTYNEIMHQPQAWSETLNYLNKNVNLYRDMIKKSFDSYLFTGCGTSYNLSLSAAALWQSITQTPTRGIPASEVFLFPEMICVPGGKYLLFGISRSGETTETVKAVTFFRENFQGMTIGISCDEGSSLLKNVHIPLLTSSAHELSVVMSQSFTTMLLTILYLAYFRTGRVNHLTDLSSVLEKLISRYKPLAQQLGENLAFEKFIFLGNGPYYGIAWEGSLKLKEMSLTPTETFHFLEFRHGPKSIVDEKTLIIALTSFKAFQYEKDVLNEMSDLGATIFHIGGKSLDLPARCQEVLIEENVIDDHTAPLLYAVFLQLLGYYRARARGMNPDQPKNLTKVVQL